MYANFLKNILINWKRKGNFNKSSANVRPYKYKYTNYTVHDLILLDSGRTFRRRKLLVSCIYKCCDLFS